MTNPRPAELKHRILVGSGCNPQLRPSRVAAEFSWLCRHVLIFDVVPRSRSSGGERPPHTRKVTGSIPVGTTVKGRALGGRTAQWLIPGGDD